jgi:hypothetical protein
MRKFAFAAVVALSSVAPVSSGASARPGPEGALNSAFNSFFNGAEAIGVVTFEHGGAGWFHAANNAYVADTFSPLPGSPSGPFCDTDTFGMWAVIFDTRDFLGEFPDSRWYLNGEEFAATRTPVKTIVDPTGFWADFVGDRASWFSDGVAVYGTLEAGTYELTVEFPFPEGTDTFSNTIVVEEC